MKCIEDEIPFDLPEGWAWARLLSIIEEKPTNGYSPKGVEYITNVRNLTLTATTSGFFKPNEFKYVDVKIAPDSRYWLRHNDILIQRSNSRELVGTSCIYDDKDAAFIYPDLMMRIHLMSSIDVRYIDSVLKSTLTREYYIANATGSAGSMPKINQAIVANTLIPLPPCAEQKRLVQYLDEVMNFTSSIETGKKDILELISMAKAKILDLAIRGQLIPQDPADEPASVLLERIRAEKEELIRQGKIKRDKKESVIFRGEDNSYYRTVGKSTDICGDLPFDLPQGWQWTCLGQYCEKVTDQVASGSFASLRENVVSFKEPNYAIMVKTADFSNNFTKNLTYTDKHGYEFLENSNLFGGELILSNIGSIGKIFIVPDLKMKMTLAPNSVMIRLTNNEYRDYLYYFLQSPMGYEELKAISTGVAMLKFNKTDLKTIYIPLPPFAEQKRIVAAIEQTFAQLDSIAENLS